MQLSRQEDIAEFMKLFNRLKSDTATLKTAVTSVSDDNPGYKAIKGSVQRVLGVMKDYSGGKSLGKAVRKILQELKGSVDAVNAELQSKRTFLDKAVIDATKYEQGVFAEIEALTQLNTKDKIYGNMSQSDAAARARIVKNYNESVARYNNQKRDMQKYIRQGETELLKVGKEIDKMNRQWGLFKKTIGFTEPRIPSLRDPPLVPIFDDSFTPQEFPLGEDTASSFKSVVGDAIQEADEYMTYDDLCAKTGQPSHLTNAQKTPYHYSNPSNPVSILLKHSAGAGKTAAMTLATSLYVRAGYLPIIVTTEALASETTYEEATFHQCADWNIQQLMALNNCKTFVDLVQKSDVDPSLADVYAQGKAWYGEMARGPAWDKSLKITFRELTRLCISYIHSVHRGKDTGHYISVQEASKILRARAPTTPGTREPRHKIFHKTVFLMDEVHSMMNEPIPKDIGGGKVDSDQNALGDIRTVTKALWLAREESPGEGPVVIAASATPGLDGFEFVMLLNLLCERKEGYEFDDTRGTYITADNYFYSKKNLKVAFNAKYPKFEDIAKPMAYGHVSYYDSAGSRSVPEMRPLKCEVTLTGAQSEAQEQAIKDLNKNGVHLVEASDGSWFIETEFEHRYNRTVKKNDSTTIQSFIESVKRNAISADYYQKGVQEVNSSDTKSKPTLKSYEDVDKWEHNAQLISPLYYETIQLIKKNKGLGVRKQYVYISLKETRARAVGITLFCNMLDSLLRYEDVCDTTRDKSSPPEGVYGKLSISDNPKDEERKKLRNVLSKFNSTANKNGSVIDVIVLDPSYKEGISLSGVGVVYIVGIVDSKSDLVQSVARAFRNCRTNPNDLRPTQDVPVYLMMPYVEGADVYEIIKGAKQTHDDVDRIAAVCKECAFDKELLYAENEKAAKNAGKLQTVAGL